jgi:hypothetical protein
MRAWLAAKSEEDKRRQEEEKSRQATLLLEQRKVEHDILQSALQGGIPPPMVPVVFAGMGGSGLSSPQALEWAQQFIQAQAQQSHAPALLTGGQITASPRRDSMAPGYGPYAGSAGVPSTPGSVQGPTSGYMSAYPGSPTRPRGQSLSAWPSRQAGGPNQNLPSLNTAFSGRTGGDAPLTHTSATSAQQRDPDASQLLIFHHYQPATGSGGGKGSGTDQAGAASGSSKNKPRPKQLKSSA